MTEKYDVFIKNGDVVIGQNIEKLNKISQYIKYIILFCVIFGHIMYILKQKKHFGIKFDIFKLYKGEKCIII